MSLRPACRVAALNAVWLLVLTWTAWIYWPGLAGPEIFDDVSNLGILAVLDESPEHLMDVVLGNRSGPSGRPVSMLSFALEKVHLDRGIRGSKEVNLMLHLLCGTLVALLLFQLLQYAQVSGAQSIAMTLAALWLVSPLYVSTVLYPVQRMAQLSTVFMLASLVFYVVWRTRWRGTGISWLLWLGMPPLVLSAILSKENGVVVVPILLLLELLWFQFRDLNGNRLVTLQRFVWSALAFGSLALLALQIAFPEWLVSGYRQRPFDLTQRLLSQGQILWNYIGQLMWPDVSIMGVFHDDYPIPSTILSPISVLWSWLAWCLVFAVLFVVRRYEYGRYAAFAVLFFLVGHSIESSVLALELYFEHRNYFPGVGLFLLVGLCCGMIIRWLPEVRIVLLTMLSVAGMFVSSQTSSQVQIWSQEGILTINNVTMHPESPRSNINMAVLLARYGAVNEALDYSARAADLNAESAGDTGVRALLLSCYANKPLSSSVFHGLPLWSVQGQVIDRADALIFLVSKLQDAHCPQVDAVAIADKFIVLLLSGSKQRWADASVYSRLAILESALERYDNALDYARLSLSDEPDTVPVLLMQLHFSTILDRAVLAAETRDKLLLLAEQGKLSLQQQQTLTLY